MRQCLSLNQPYRYLFLALFSSPLILLSGCDSTSSVSSAASTTFTSGDLIVSRTVYSGTASTVTVGQMLPPGAASAVAATSNGSFPAVFQNETPDPSFGISSPIYLDRLKSNGSLISTVTIDPTLISSSFASKSELALNISTDGSAISFMGYKAPINAIDVSNSNTAAVVDTTNPVPSTYSRAIAQVNLTTGNLTVTPVNAYSGNNGRAAVLANGNYYMVGNAGNGSAAETVLDQLSINTGVQSISATGTGGATTQVGACTGTLGTSGYQCGFSLNQLPNLAINPQTNPITYYAADKTGKDNNFRGLTIFNNTLYVSKGSGSNGVNTVYQVGASGVLAGGKNISNATLTVLPGFNALSEKVAEAKATLTATPHPFGLWFANATTLFVADEGDGNLIGATGKVTTFSGLQEWTLSGGTWTKVATFTKGLLDQSVYTLGMASPYNWNIQTDGLRNLTGKVNADGSFTLYATTSTVSNDGNHDLGADPNEVVSITITPTSTAVNTSFTVLQTAPAGQRFGGVAIAP